MSSEPAPTLHTLYSGSSIFAHLSCLQIRNHAHSLPQKAWPFSIRASVIVTGPSLLCSVKPRMARGEWPVAAAWLLAFFTLTPAPCHGPAPARRRQEKVKRCCSAAWLLGSPGPGRCAQAAANQTFTFLCSPRPSPSPAPQPSCRQFPFTLLELVQARGRIATPMCYITIISAPSPATEPWASTPTFILTLIHYFSKSQFASLLYDSAYHQSNILCHCTGRYLDI